jgi:hypothetical protein
MRPISKFGGSFLAILVVFGATVRCFGGSGDLDSKYAALPNLTDDQKSKIAAIEKQADDQIMALLTDEQKSALQSQSAPAAAAPGSGLYSNDATSMTSGPIASRDYWESKFNADQLEQAIKDRQPEGAIALQLISATQLVDDLLKKYPNHRELQAWHDRFTAVQKQIGDNFDRSAEFKPSCLWNQDSYMQTYVGYNTAKTAMTVNDQELAFMMSGLALSKVNILTESDDRMALYPADAKAWIKGVKPELEDIHQKSGKATNHF